MKYNQLLCWSIIVLCPIFAMAADDFPDPFNTQAAGEHPPAPREMLELFELPEGFQVTLFAGEPDVQQPIAFDFDDKGRIWVAENYTYSAHGKTDPNLRDRIVILHDKDGDGEHDERKVFWDKGSMLTGLTWGYGGLWILNDGTLSFVPDKNGDDIPDSEPIEMLNGWTRNAGHNFVSGLFWGPDGWLYGRHGITDTSYPGTPDTPQSERQPINCGIWRFHPVKHAFEVVCNGTTNPWGLDCNNDGDMFMSNNVIGHLWHVIPGAHYQRMFGQDFNPHLYELMEQCADHYHWDNTGNWTQSRDGKAANLGGGHSHCGLMIYQGQNFPPEYKGKAFMCNTHGRCVNVDRLERQHSGYVAKHRPNFLKVNTPWFRGVELKYGPRGCVYLTDWSDNGECHDHDGVHRTSGRIYRISFGDPIPESLAPLESSSDVELAKCALQMPQWFSRRAIRLIAEIAHSTPARDFHVVQHEMQVILSNPIADTHTKLSALRVLDATDGLSHSLLQELIKTGDEVLAGYAVQRGIELGEFRAPPANPATSFDLANAGNAAPLIELVQSTKSSRVLLAVASALQKIDSRSRLMIIKPLIARLSEFNDRQLNLLTWYALTEETAPAALMYAVDGPNTPSLLLKFAVRRIAQLQDSREAVLGQLLSADGPAKTADAQVAVLTGLTEGYRGQLHPDPPNQWETAQNRFMASNNPQVVELAQKLSALFGDGAAISNLRQLVADRNGDHAGRSQAIAALSDINDLESLNIFLSLLNDRAVYLDIAKALAAFDDPRIPTELLHQWNNLRHGAREAATDTLCSRKSYAMKLTKAIDEGQVAATDLTAAQVRQLLAFNEPAVTQVINAKWGVINESSEAKAAMMANLKARLTSNVLGTADISNGAALFKKTCAACHKLYGEGGQIGPDLTGSNRGNLDYLLGNIVDPSREVPRQFTVSVIALTSGRVVTGVVVGETEQTIQVQTDKELQTIAISEIEDRIRTTKSLMPDGLLDTLSPEQIRDMLAFVMKRR